MLYHEYGESRYYMYLSIHYMHNIDILRIFLSICFSQFHTSCQILLLFCYLLHLHPIADF